MEHLIQVQGKTEIRCRYLPSPETGESDNENEYFFRYDGHNRGALHLLAFRERKSARNAT
jgi:hypothetical protein